jgi:hypothetical protein
MSSFERRRLSRGLPSSGWNWERILVETNNLVWNMVLSMSSDLLAPSNGGWLYWHFSDANVVVLPPKESRKLYQCKVYECEGNDNKEKIPVNV